MHLFLFQKNLSELPHVTAEVTNFVKDIIVGPFMYMLSITKGKDTSSCMKWYIILELRIYLFINLKNNKQTKQRDCPMAAINVSFYILNISAIID